MAERQNKLINLKNALQNKKLTHDEMVKAKEFMEGPPLIDIPRGDIILADDSKDARNAAKKEAIERVKTAGSQVVHTPDSQIIFNAAGVKNSIRHTINQEKLDAIPYIPEGLKKSFTIDVSNDLDGGSIRNIHKVVPVKSNKNNKILMMRARQNIGNTHDINFYHHMLLDTDELKEKGDSYNQSSVANPAYNTDSQKTGNNQPPVAYTGTNPGGQWAGHKGIAYIKNILHDILNVNDNQKGNAAQTANDLKKSGTLVLPNAGSRNRLPVSRRPYDSNIPQTSPDVKNISDAWRTKKSTRGRHATVNSPPQLTSKTSLVQAPDQNIPQSNPEVNTENRGSLLKKMEEIRRRNK